MVTQLRVDHQHYNRQPNFSHCCFNLYPLPLLLASIAMLHVDAYLLHTSASATPADLFTFFFFLSSIVEFSKGKGEHEEGVDENNKGPIFPRLHVNDTEKGGPRAPPRNKIALYEQLSVPSQRLNANKDYLVFKCLSFTGLPQPMVEDDNTFPQKVSPIPIKKIQFLF
ncbi:hypothetical protein LXL04_017854 [Taraxacum kok-saghyz]